MGQSVRSRPPRSPWSTLRAVVDGGRPPRPAGGDGLARAPWRTGAQLGPGGGDDLGKLRGDQVGLAEEQLGELVDPGGGPGLDGIGARAAGICAGHRTGTDVTCPDWHQGCGQGCWFPFHRVTRLLAGRHRVGQALIACRSPALVWMAILRGFACSATGIVSLSTPSW